MTSSPVRARPSWPALDGLRALAALAVVAHHAFGLPNGYLGVDIFFVLSGFLITSLLVREREATGRVRLPQFYLRRALRLYPALVTVVVATTLSVFVVRDETGKLLGAAVAALFYVANIWFVETNYSGLLDHVWTLALEEQFYLVWPPLLALWAWRRPRVAAGALVAGAVGVAFLGPWGFYDRTPGILLGAAAALVHRDGALARRLGPLPLIALGALLLPDLILPTGRTSALFGLAFLPLVIACTGQGVVARILSWRPLREIGRRSYGLYLWHFPLLILATVHLPGEIPHWARVWGALAATAVATVASYQLIELPFLRWKGRLAAKPEPGAQHLPAPRGGAAQVAAPQATP